MDKKQEHKKAEFGLLGKNISYSFSKTYFTNKFKMAHLPHSYTNFDIPNIAQFSEVIDKNPQLKGLNVTIPYKEKIIPFLDNIDPIAKQIGAVNTIKFKDNKLVGYNSDYYGFKGSISKYLKPNHKQALILGTGGASKAVYKVLLDLDIKATFVSRTSSKPNTILYADVNKSILKSHHIIINCTPLGTFPDVNSAPDIPYQFLTAKHLLFDLIYNPKETLFLRRGKRFESVCCNGLKMLEFQAEKSWAIWQEA
ncbi:MAG: shikimate dehydrogenase [Bacteroidetes bacterium MedPE-SWsnd-G2]|nr:MAG: shikimate dehydrogenase [Bacteroidetes bacterium MedPE-SWsnd-G2]